MNKYLSLFLDPNHLKNGSLRALTALIKAMTTAERTKAKEAGILKNLEGRFDREFASFSLAEKLEVLQAMVGIPLSDKDFAPFRSAADACQQEVLSFGLFRTNLLSQVLDFDTAVRRASERGTLTDFEFIYKTQEWTRRVVQAALETPETFVQGSPKLIAQLLRSLVNWRSSQTTDLATQLYSAAREAFLLRIESAPATPLVTFMQETESLDQPEATQRCELLLGDLSGADIQQTREDLVLEFNNPL